MKILPFQKARMVRQERTSQVMQMSTTMMRWIVKKPGMFSVSPSTRSVAIQPTCNPALAPVHPGREQNVSARGTDVGEGKRPATEDLVEVLVQLEPVGERAEEEEEHSEAEEHQRSDD